MNLIIGAPTWLIALLCLALFAAAIEDALRLRISNLTCVAVLAGALTAVAIHGFSLALWQNALVFAAILILGTAAFAAEWLGGGDVKLLAALGLWFNLDAAMGFIAAVFIVGGFISLIYIAGRRIMRRSGKPRSANDRIPYGLAIVAGAAFMFIIQMNSRPANPFIEQMRAVEANKPPSG